MGEKAKDVTLITIGELFPIGEWQVRKVAMGKLYDTEGTCVEDLFLKTGRTYEGDPIDWKQEAAVSKMRYFPHTAGESEGSKEHGMSEALDTSEERFITRVIGMAIKEEPKDENIPAKMRRFMRSHSQRMPTETVTSSSQPPELLETIDLCSSDEGEKTEEHSTVVQPRKEPTTEVPPADDDDEESSSSSEDGSDDDDNDEDLFDIEELQEIYEKHLTDQPKEFKPMEEGWEEMDTRKAS